MSEHPSHSTIKVPSNGMRVTLAIVTFQVIYFVAQLYLSNGYVSKATYEQDVKERIAKQDEYNKSLNAIVVELKGINDHMLGDAEQNEKLKDLEARMRAQEQRK